MIITRLHKSPHSWPEDFHHENGNYQNKCVSCGAEFISHKRRPICRLCTYPMIYISGKIGDLPKEVSDQLFRDGEKKAAALGYVPINPKLIDHTHSKDWLDYMQRDIVGMMQPECRTIYMLRNWTNSPGAVREFNLALSLGYRVIFEDPDTVALCL